MEPTASQQSSISHRPWRAGECRDGLQVERIAQRVGQHDGARARREGRFELRRHRRCRWAPSTSTKTGTRPFCKMGLTVVGKPAATVMTSSPGAQPPVAQLGRGQGREGQQVGGGAGVDQHALAHAEPAREFAFERVGEAAGGEPEIQRGIHQQAHFGGIEHPAGDGHGGFAGHERPWRRRPRRSIRPTRSRICSRKLVRPRSAHRQKLPIPGDGPLQTFFQGEQRRPAEHPPGAFGAQILMADFIAGLVADVRFESATPWRAESGSPGRGR